MRQLRKIRLLQHLNLRFPQKVAKMAASVRIEDEAFVDPRVELLGIIAGYNRFEALGRLSHLWRVCTQRETYVLPDEFVVALLGEKGPAAIIESGLGERVADGIRIKGTKGRIEWLKQRRAAARSGGESNRQKSSSKAKPKANSRKPKDIQEEELGSQTVSSCEPNGSQTGAKREPNNTPPTLTPILCLPTEDSLSPAVAAKEENPPEAKKIRTRNLLFDAIAEITDSAPKASGSYIAKVTKALASEEPPFTPEEVRDFRKRFRQLCTWAEKENRDVPTLNEVEKYIGRVRSVKPTANLRNPVRDSASGPTAKEIETRDRLAAEAKQQRTLMD